MKTQTKCTASLLVMLIIEILPIPLTSIFCIYVIRKRPAWLPGVVERLYEGKENYQELFLINLDGHDSLVTRRRCTFSLSIMILLDFLIPFTILFGLYIARRRPIWFQNVVIRLYKNLHDNNEVIEHSYASLIDNSIDS